MNLDAFLADLSLVEPIGGPFCNPYNPAHNTPDLDVPDGASIRLENAKAYFHAFPEPPKVLLIGEAPGPWGARFSGVPFTSEHQFVHGNLPFKGQPTSRLATGLAKEMSGALVWELVRPRWPDVMCWNTVPWHPYKTGERLSIRTPTPTEVNWALPLLKDFLHIVKPQKVVAVGRKAEGACSAIGVPTVYVRHPSMGGATAFRAGFQSMFDQRPELALRRIVLHCSHCNKQHVDKNNESGDWADVPHTRHLCESCGKPFFTKTATIGVLNP